MTGLHWAGRKEDRSIQGAAGWGRSCQPCLELGRQVDQPPTDSSTTRARVIHESHTLNAFNKAFLNSRTEVTHEAVLHNLCSPAHRLLKPKSKRSPQTGQDFCLANDSTWPLWGGPIAALKVTVSSLENCPKLSEKDK